MSSTEISPERKSDGKGWLDLGPHDPIQQAENPDLLVPPEADHGGLPNLWFSFAHAHQRLEDGGWARQVTQRELPASTDVAGVNMALAPGSYRELHWHREAEWAYMLVGSARVTSLDPKGRYFIDDVKAGDLWNFEAGYPHSIQSFEQGCEFLLVFSDGSFSEDNTFLLTDWFAHVPKDVLAANLKTTQEALASIPRSEKYIFPGTVPGPIDEVVRKTPQGTVPSPFTLHMDTIEPIECEAGRVRIIDVDVFPAAKTICAAVIEIEPGGMRELHWHPQASEWQYYIQGKARMGVFNATANARTVDFVAGDVGFVPIVAGHYIVNTGDEKLVFLEVFRTPHYEDFSMTKWLAATPAPVVAEHLDISVELVKSFPQEDSPTPIVWYDESKTKLGRV